MENKNQKLEIERLDSEILDQEVDKATYDIRTYGADFTLEILSKKINEGEIIIPEFQRKYVWNQKKGSRLIESFLLGLPVPQVFLYRENDTQNLLVIDGQQRLRTVNYFINGKFATGKTFFLLGVKEAWEGKNFAELSKSDQRKLNNTILRATIFEQIKPENEASSMFQIFERLNSGGMTLSQQEIRKSIYYGEIVDFLEKLNMYSNWREILHKNEPEIRMRDIEMILRFFALSDSWENYDDAMKDFISKYMEKNRHISKAKKDELSIRFKSVIDKVYENLGSKSAFRIRSGINVAVFDSVTVALAVLGNKAKNNIKASYEELIKNDVYLSYVSKATTNKTVVQGRIKMAISAFSK